MARKKKGRATKKNVQAADAEPEELRNAPHSFVITRGNVGGYVHELAKDFRKIMEPFTATNLKARKKNTLKDFVSVAGPLHVSHICSFTQTEVAVYLKVARLPRGPTLTLRVHSYTLARDVLSSVKRPVATSKLYNDPPLVVLNSFSGEGMHLKLLATTFQNMFPSINLTKVKLSSVRRCLLLNYDPETKMIDLRHYAIRAVPVGLSRGVKKLVQAKVPDLSRFTEISEFITKAGQLSESEAEDDPASHVDLPQDLPSRGNVAAAKSAVRLVELGPRFTLQLVKVEEGLMAGEVMFHEYVHKTEEEKLAISKLRNQKAQLKATRRKQQEDNVKRKGSAKDDHKQRSLLGQNQNETQVEDDDDAEWYRSEVGQEPEKDLFDMSGKKRRYSDNAGNSDVKKRRLYNRDTSKDSEKSSDKFGRSKDSSQFKRKQDKFRTGDNERGYHNKSSGKFGDKTFGGERRGFNRSTPGKFSGKPKRGGRRR